MIRRIQALNYRCLRYVDVYLDGSFHILVGPNASGKSTLLDVISFLGDLVSDGLDAAVNRRTRNFQDLVWDRQSKNPGFELAVEFEIPKAIRFMLPAKKHRDESFRFFRYEVSIRLAANGLCIGSEGGFLKSHKAIERERGPSVEEDVFASLWATSFPSTRPKPNSILTDADGFDCRRVFQKTSKGTDTFYAEDVDICRGPKLRVAFGPRRSTLKNLPEHPGQFPVSTYVKRILDAGVQELFLDSRRLRRASSPNNPRTGFVPDGSNLPWAIKRLRETNPGKFREWLDHVRTALREIEDIRIVEREDDRHAYLMLGQVTGVEVPSWTVSDGTLRLLALTLTAYLPDGGKIFLMKEPENGMHPMAIETVYQSLSSVYYSQVLVATHSPVFLSCAPPEEILCFAKDKKGATDIIAGHQHPRLADWRSSADTTLLFASEVFG